MLPKGVKYKFTASPWVSEGPGGWCFVSLPKSISKEIRKIFRTEEEGWGRLKATAKIGRTEWRTAIWFDTKLETYLLPLKSEIRQKENLELESSLNFTVWI